MEINEEKIRKHLINQKAVLWARFFDLSDEKDLEDAVEWFMKQCEEISKF